MCAEILLDTYTGLWFYSWLNLVQYSTIHRALLYINMMHSNALSHSQVYWLLPLVPSVNGQVLTVSQKVSNFSEILWITESQGLQDDLTVHKMALRWIQHTSETHCTLNWHWSYLLLRSYHMMWELGYKTHWWRVNNRTKVEAVRVQAVQANIRHVCTCYKREMHILHIPTHIDCMNNLLYLCSALFFWCLPILFWLE